MSDDKNKVPPFDGTNYSNWKFRIETLLDKMDLLDVIQEPLDKLIQNLRDSQEAAQIKATKENIRRKEKRCKSQIVQRVADTHLELNCAQLNRVQNFVSICNVSKCTASDAAATDRRSGCRTTRRTNRITARQNNFIVNG
ncbi:unnamed protein product [Lasius platythorax]|uniref:DUF4219 domain-containing protein n=1 Tax=Lasius platythorax TaxID=488582 RepID=A0AAV2NP61_9HYME